MRKEIYLVLAIIFGGFIAYFSIIPVIEVAGIGLNAGALKHIAAYFLLALLMYKATEKLSLAVFLSGLYGFLIEAIQFTIPYRVFDVSDIIFNFMGASIVLFSFFFRKNSY